MEVRSEIKRDSIGLIVDHSVVFEKVKIDTLIKVPGKRIIQDTKFNIDSLVNGITAIKNELIDVKFILNPITGMLSTEAYFKPINVPFKYDYEKVTHTDKTQQSKQSESNMDIISTDEGKSIVEKDPINLNYVAGFILLGLIVCSIILWIRRR